MDASYKLHPWWWFEEPAVGAVPGYNWEGGIPWLALRHFLGVENKVPELLNGDGLSLADSGIYPTLPSGGLGPLYFNLYM